MQVFWNLKQEQLKNGGGDNMTVMDWISMIALMIALFALGVAIGHNNNNTRY